MDPRYFQGGMQQPQGSDFLQQLGPEGMAAFMGMGTLENQDADLQQQIAQAQAMRTQAGPQRSGAMAGGIQMIADLLRAYKGRQQEGKLRDERKTLMGDMEGRRSTIARKLFPAAPAPVNDGIPDLLRRPPE